MTRAHNNRAETKPPSPGLKTKNPFLLALCVAVLIVSVLRGNMGISVGTITFDPQVKESPSPGNNNKGISVITPDPQVPESEIITETESPLIKSTATTRMADDQWLQLGSLLQQRVMALDRTKIFSFVHIPKAGGSQWWYLIVETLEKSKKSFRKRCKQQRGLCQLFPPRAAGTRYELPLLYTVTRAPHANYTLISLRSPLHHVFSQYSHCRYFKGGTSATLRKKTLKKLFRKNNKNNNIPMSLDEGFEKWLSLFAVHTDNNTPVTNNGLSVGAASSPSSSYRIVESYDRHTCYNPINVQSRFLTSSKRVQDDNFSLEPESTESISNLRRHTDFVGILDFYHESKCLFYHRTMMLKTTSKTKHKSDDMEVVQRIQDYLDERCRCPWPEAVFNEKKVEHHKKGKRKTMVDLSPTLKEMVATVAGKDMIMYKSALMDFFHEILWLESPAQLDRRVMCDESLQKQELELAYLGLNVSHLYSYAKAKVDM